MLIGIVGKTNVGKTTFFSAATLVEAEIGDRPFVTINPNEGVGYVRVKSVCTEFGLRCEPRFGWCNGRYRYVPVKLLDVAGLVPGAHLGRGLGNKFLDDLRKASVHILIVDASGATDEEGRPAKPGSYDPLRDALLVKEEFSHWLKGIIQRNMVNITRKINIAKEKPEVVLGEVLSGLGITKEDVSMAAKELDLDLARISNWTEDQIFSFASLLREKTKPMLIAANKIDVPGSEENLERLRANLSEPVIPTSAEAELILRKAASAGLIRYEPGDSGFEIIDESKLAESQIKALKLIQERVLDVYGSTGVQEALDKSLFEIAHFKAIFPVENETKLSDKDGRVLPDVLLLPESAEVRDVAAAIHSEIAEKAIAGLDVRNKVRISLSYVPEHRNVIRILTRR
ncbi:MAG TPA: redox-regulated ATPase YchF [Candidatus Korarchaeota archaeon]|nr:redox-regulated ATPase YchF [Candidatus Korarchaeota archaeon]